MARNTNTVILVGHLGSDPRNPPISKMADKLPHLISLSVMITEIDKGNTVKRTHWIPIVVHGNSADVGKTISTKGSKSCNRETGTGKLARPKRQ